MTIHHYGAEEAQEMDFQTFCHRAAQKEPDNERVVVSFRHDLTKAPTKADAEDLIDRIIIGQAEEDEIIHFLRRIK